jgi:hypothetical protein
MQGRVKRPSDRIVEGLREESSGVRPPVQPTRTTGTDLVSSLMAANDEGFVARGSIDSAEHSVSWIVGIATEPVERHHGLVLGSRGPMAFVILVSDERGLLDVIGAIRAAIPRAG